MEPSFGDLPFLVLKKIFRIMPNLKEAIKCSLVCKNWREAYETMVRPQSLCLHLQAFIPLNHRLFYTNERVDPFAFFKYPDHSQFLRSELAMGHFKQIKKLILFIFYADYALPLFRLREQLNHYESLEHVELQCKTLVQEECEINLPNLKSFWCHHMKFEENAQVVLNTPSLEIMRLVEYSRKCSEDSEGSEDSAEITNFKFQFPEKLKYLEMYNHKTGFKFDIEFPNLECLVFPDTLHSSERVRLFGDDFLESLPSLRFLYFSWFRDLDLPILEEEKRKLNRKDLKICDEWESYKFDYKNWSKYVKDREQLSHWPSEKVVVFDQLIDCKIPLKYFEENYLRVRELKVRQVADQALLVNFLKKVHFQYLVLEYDCNLGQSFLDEVADSVTVSSLSIDECVLNRLSDLSVLSRLNAFCMEVYFQQFRREAVSAVLRNLACARCYYYPYDGFDDEGPDLLLGEDFFRKGYRERQYYDHAVLRAKSEFYCDWCCWISSNDPNHSKKGPMEVTIQHIESHRARNTSYEESEHMRIMTQFSI